MNRNDLNNAGNKIKRIRQAKILDIIETNDITTQEELTILLREAGFDATQATVSRDIRDLKLTKSSDRSGAYKYVASDSGQEQSENKYEKILVEAALNSVTASNLVIVKTYAGMANAACAAIDRLSWAEVAGSIAGDDTIFIACYTEDKAKTVLERLKSIIGK
jgi:transcriptional regulator of arginine metabolism